nr:hypothetical protein HmN_000351600 [Hymenolepis microstoma]
MGKLKVCKRYDFHF